MIPSSFTKKVFIMRGLPGSGKSHYVKNNLPELKSEVIDLNWDIPVTLRAVVSADHFFENEKGEYNFNPSLLPEAHRACLKSFLDHLQNRVQEVVVDNTNTQLWEMSPYVALGEAFGYEVKILHIRVDIETSVSRNTHGVPRRVIGEMWKRWEKPLPWWKEEIISGMPPEDDDVRNGL